MNEAARFQFLDANPEEPGTGLMPLMPLTLQQDEQQVQAVGLLDTGAAVNVLPYTLGLQLGLRWDQQRTPLTLSGNLARLPAYGILVSMLVAHFAPVRLVFAWTQTENIPLLLGQTNFFLEFDVCVYRARSEFEIKPKQQI